MTRAKAAKIEPGLMGFCERVVSHELTLAQIDPKLPAVFSTPAMIGMMEMASSHALRQALPAGSITVGVRIEVDHLKAVPAGATVIANAKLVEVHGRRLIFEVEARSGNEVIGRGRVYHVVVDHARFIATAKGSTA
jgi:fluoroacetyl-CoA thioesterase